MDSQSCRQLTFAIVAARPGNTEGQTPSRICDLEYCICLGCSIYCTWVHRKLSVYSASQLGIHFMQTTSESSSSLQVMLLGTGDKSDQNYTCIRALPQVHGSDVACLLTGCYRAPSLKMASIKQFQVHASRPCEILQLHAAFQCVACLLMSWIRR